MPLESFHLYSVSTSFDDVFDFTVVKVFVSTSKDVFCGSCALQNAKENIATSVMKSVLIVVTVK